MRRLVGVLIAIVSLVVMLALVFQVRISSNSADARAVIDRANDFLVSVKSDDAVGLREATVSPEQRVEPGPDDTVIASGRVTFGPSGLASRPPSWVAFDPNESLLANLSRVDATDSIPVLNLRDMQLMKQAVSFRESPIRYFQSDDPYVPKITFEFACRGVKPGGCISILMLAFDPQHDFKVDSVVPYPNTADWRANFARSYGTDAAFQAFDPVLFPSLANHR